MTDNTIEITRSTLQPKVYAGYDFASIERNHFYFGPEDKRLFGCIHYVPGIKQSDTSILICPSLGVEYMNAYRPLRYVADYHALEGIPALRFDYQGTGDSSGLNDKSNRMEDWLWSIREACERLKELTNCKRVILFGFRMGASFATLVAESIAIEDLILWAPVENGRRYLREIKALQMTAEHQQEGDLLEAGGAVFYSEIISALGGVKLSDCKPKAQRVLIIPRDDLPSNEKLKEAWISKGIEATQIQCDGFADMLVDAHNVEIPHNAIQKVTVWSKNATKPNLIKLESMKLPVVARINHFNPCLHESINDSSAIEEQIIRYGPDGQRIAILSRPEKSIDNGKPVIVLANSGANHRVGPNRLYVLLARELCRKGFNCLRVDIDGLGDSAISDPEKENIVYIDHSSDEIRLSINALEKEINSSEYVVMGLCSGAYFSFHAALDLNDINIAECILINPLTFYWQEGMSLDVSPTQNHQDWNWYKFALKNPASWAKMFKGRIQFKALTKTLFNRIKMVVASKLKQNVVVSRDVTKSTNLDDLSSDLLAIADKNIIISLYLARRDPGYDILMTSAGRTAKRLLKRKKIKIKFFEDADHTFSRNKARCDLVTMLVSNLSKKYKSPQG